MPAKRGRRMMGEISVIGRTRRVRLAGASAGQAGSFFHQAAQRRNPSRFPFGRICHPRAHYLSADHPSADTYAIRVLTRTSADLPVPLPHRQDLPDVTGTMADKPKAGQDYERPPSAWSAPDASRCLGTV